MVELKERLEERDVALDWMRNRFQYTAARMVPVINSEGRNVNIDLCFLGWFETPDEYDLIMTANSRKYFTEAVLCINFPLTNRFTLYISILQYITTLERS